MAVSRWKSVGNFGARGLGSVASALTFSIVEFLLSEYCRQYPLPTAARREQAKPAQLAADRGVGSRLWWYPCSSAVVTSVTAELKTSELMFFPKQVPLKAIRPLWLSEKGALASSMASLSECLCSSWMISGSASLKGLSRTLLGGLPGKSVKMEGSGGFFGFGGRVGARVRVCTGGGCGSSAM